LRLSVDTLEIYKKSLTIYNCYLIIPMISLWFKAWWIEKAMRDVPLENRSDIFSSTDASSVNVQKALASHPLYFGTVYLKEDKTTIDDDKANQLFHDMKAKLHHVDDSSEQSGPSSPLPH